MLSTETLGGTERRSLTVCEAAVESLIHLLVHLSGGRVKRRDDLVLQAVPVRR